MKKTLKKSLAMLLSLMMIVSAFSVGSLAALAEEYRGSGLGYTQEEE